MKQVGFEASCEIVESPLVLWDERSLYESEKPRSRVRRCLVAVTSHCGPLAGERDPPANRKRAPEPKITKFRLW